MKTKTIGRLFILIILFYFRGPLNAQTATQTKEYNSNCASPNHIYKEFKIPSCGKIIPNPVLQIARHTGINNQYDSLNDENLLNSHTLNGKIQTVKIKNIQQSPLAHQNVWKKQNYSQPFSSFAQDVSETYDYGYLTGGMIRDLSPPYYGYILKTDINGEKLWQKIVSGTKESEFESVTTTSDGGFIAGGNYNNEGNRDDAYIMKFNPCAEPEWCSMIPESNGYSSFITKTIQEDKDGNFYALRHVPTFDPVYKWSISKYSPGGKLIWINNYIVDNPDWSIGSQIDWRLNLTSDTCLLVNGSVYDTVFYQTGGMCSMPHWYKVDKNGTLLWETKWNLTEEQYAGDTRKTIEDKNNNYYSCGSLHPPVGFPYIFKLSHDGDTIQSYRVYDHPDAIVGDLQTLNFLDDTTLVVGTQFGLTTDDVWWSINLTDTLGIVKKGKYEEEWAIQVKSLITHDNKILQLMLWATKDGSWPYTWIGLYKFNTNLEYDSIYTIPRTYDSLCPHPIVSDTISMPGICINVSLPEAPKTGETQQLKVYPNPASTFVTIEIPEFSVTTMPTGIGTQQQFRPLSGEVQLSVINLSGQIVKTEAFDASERNHVIKVHDLTPGMYMLHLTQKGKFVAQGKVMVVR